MKSPVDRCCCRYRTALFDRIVNVAFVPYVQGVVMKLVSCRGVVEETGGADSTALISVRWKPSGRWRSLSGIFVARSTAPRRTRSN